VSAPNAGGFLTSALALARNVVAQAQAAQVRPIAPAAPAGTATVPAPRVSPSTLAEAEEVVDALRGVFAAFKVRADVVRVVRGPTITRYEVRPGPGVKVSAITGLTPNMALALSEPRVRVETVVPGRPGCMSVEVRNKRRATVSLSWTLRAVVGMHPLTVGLGADMVGLPVVANLADMPHILVAGETGAGKSACLNSIICSVLLRASPDQVRMLLVDPKRVEFGAYAQVPHLITPIVTHPNRAADALAWVTREMDDRYTVMADAGVAHVDHFNDLVDRGRLPGRSRYPYLLVVVDELADLMMVAPADVELSVVRIAQLARAAGIHLVLATQRPSTDVVTGLIKTNMPVRLAFSASSDVDSRVILGVNGAENLLGRGDALYRGPGTSELIRLQGAYISADDVRSVVARVRQLHEPAAQVPDDVIVLPAQLTAAAAGDEAGEDAELLKQAITLVVTSQLGSASMLQRKLRIGFAKAGRLIDLMEQRGVVGPGAPGKARDVLWKESQLEDL
jgi:S-DNA-T family DNA segregation ATPase FtsK/SpoIIIE